MSEPTKVDENVLADALFSGTPLPEEHKKDTPATEPVEPDDSAGKVKTQTVARLLILIATMVNQILATLGLYASLPINEGIMDVVSLILFALAAIWCYWKNNSWTPEANLGDNVMQALKKADLSVSDILDLLASASKKK